MQYSEEYDDEGYGYRGDRRVYMYGYADHEEDYEDSSSTEAEELLIARPKKAQGEHDDHHESGSFLFTGIVLKWDVEAIASNSLDLLAGVGVIPKCYDSYSRGVMNNYYDSFLPYVLEDARATIAAGLESRGYKSAVKYSFVLERDIQLSRNPNNTCKIEIQRDLLEKVEGKSRVAVLLRPTKQPKQLSLLGLANQQGFGANTKKTVIKLILDENVRVSFNGLFLKGIEWDVSILGSVLSQERIYEACTLKPELTFLPQVIRGKVALIPEFKADNNTELNNSQFNAIKGFVDADDGMYLLQGPPGTGKTSTIVELILALYKQKKRVLICAPSNKAVQVIAARFYQKHREYDIPLVLAGVESKLPALLEPIFLHGWVKRLINFLSDLKNCVMSPEKYVNLKKSSTGLQMSQCVADKLNEFRRIIHDVEKMLKTYQMELLLPNLSSLVRKTEHYLGSLLDEDDPFWRLVFELVTNKEVEPDIRVKRYTNSQQEVQNTWSNLIAGVKKEKTIEDTLLVNASVIFSTLSVAGRKQMRQTAKVDVLIVDEAGQSIEAETLIPFILQPKKCLLVGDTKQLPATVISQNAEDKGYGRSMLHRLLEDCEQEYRMLDTQYRMHPSIRVWPSAQFYQNKIVDGPNIRSRPSPFPTLMSPLHQPYAFIQTNGQEGSEGTSFSNKSEADLILRFVNFLRDKHRVKPEEKIGIISFYAGQVRLLQSKFIKGSGPRVNTVDGFQGDENDIIIISFVRSNPKNIVGFLRDFRRLNVAITRGRHAVIMFGDEKTLRSDKNLRGLLNHLRAQKLIFPQAEFERSLVQANKNKAEKPPVSKPEAKKPIDSPSLPDNFKTKLCANFSSGKCRYGKNCHYAHGEAELLKPKAYVHKPPKEIKSSSTSPVDHGKKTSDKVKNKSDAYKARSPASAVAKGGNKTKPDKKAIPAKANRKIEFVDARIQAVSMTNEEQVKGNDSEPASSQPAKAAVSTQTKSQSKIDPYSLLSTYRETTPPAPTTNAQHVTDNNTKPASTQPARAPVPAQSMNQSKVDPYALLSTYREKSLLPPKPQSVPASEDGNNTGAATTVALKPVSASPPFKTSKITASVKAATAPSSFKNEDITTTKKKMFCRFFQNGNCPNGGKCEMLHTASPTPK
jgi:hypothetical protein